MEEHTNNTRGKQNRRSHQQLTSAIAVCLLAAIIALPLIFSNPSEPQQETVPATVDTQSSEKQSTPATATPDSGTSNTASALNQPKSSPPYNPSTMVNEDLTIISNGEDGIAAEHEGGVVLAQVAADTSIAELNAQLSSLDTLAEPTLSEEELTLGWVELPLAEGVDVPDAMMQLQACEAVESVQPNYVYRLVRDESEKVGTSSIDVSDGIMSVQPDGLNGDNPPAVTDTGESIDTQGYHKFVNDYRAKDQMIIIMLRLREAYGYLYDKGYVTQTSYDEAHINQLNTESALKWNERAGYKRPTVAVLDTGCQLDHVDLEANIIDHYDAVYPGNWRGDIDGHGTHVAGIVAATTNNGVGITGVSLNAQLLPINVFDKKTTTSSPLADSKDIARGYEYVMEHAEQYNIRVVNLSLGSDTETTDNDDKLFLEAISKAYQANILTVIASGNDAYTYNGAYCDFPTDFAENAVSVIDCAVSNVESDPNSPFLATLTLSRDGYSNYNMPNTLNKPLSALGSFVMSTVPYDTDNATYNTVGKYENKNGTSMASPCVAGLAALILQVDSNLTPEQIKSILYSTADDVTENPPGQTSYTDDVAPGFDLYTGFGTINAYQAVMAADTEMYLSADDRGETSIPVLAKGIIGAQSVGFHAPLGSDWTWASSAPGVASVDSTGLVSAKGPGQAIISATNGNNTLYTIVTVYEPKLNGADTVACNAPTTLGVDVLPERGTWKWTSNDPSVASVDSWSGTVTGKTGGKQATVTATLISNPDVKLSKNITVTAVDPPPSSDPTPAPAPEPEPEPAPEQPPVAYQPMYRLYNPNSGEHFYTKDADERDGLVALGWNSEGEGWRAPESSNTPVYRMYNPNAGEHHYTPDAAERDMLIDAGWEYESIGWYSDDAQTVPLYRDYNPNAFSNNHNYTTSAAEHEWLISLGWQAEGFAWYGV